MRNRTWRVLIGALFVGAATAGAVAGVDPAPAPRELVGGTGVDASAVRISDVPCHEGDACWNPCTMGVDGRFPPTDPRYYVPGPCDLSTVLPYGRFFRAEVVPAPLDPNAYVCATTPGWSSSRVVVLVVESDGVREVSRAEEWACTPNDDPWWAVESRLDRLARQAGLHA